MEPQISTRSISSKMAVKTSKKYLKYKCPYSSYYCAEYGRWSKDSANFDMLERLIPHQKTIECQITKVQPNFNLNFLSFISCIFDTSVDIVVGLEEGYTVVSTQHYESEIVHQVFFCQWVIVLNLLFLFTNPNWQIIIIFIQISLLKQTFRAFNRSLFLFIFVLFSLWLGQPQAVTITMEMILWVVLFIYYVQHDMTDRLIAAAIHKLVKDETLRIVDDDIIIL